ncbi:ATP-binding protein [Jiangella sp. DSM 45060]|uniref:ATP-binding protein n=1 Tax=Jiangella sp. DSM 45060 TaxID=1798224 RepID=UPI00087CB6ED|nr:ATP-binding protein [Jiangella sp. DSM 45060]SDS71152.1 ATPase family associated with various cellular activities (AAA) [Jiangella sp. DSM 45060]
MAPSLGPLVDAIATLVKHRERPGDPAASRLAAAVDALRRDHGGGTDSDDGDDVLAGTAAVFGLDPLETDLLLTAFAAEADASFATVFALLGGEATQGRPTAALALELCGVPALSASGRARLSVSGRLVRHGLATLTGDGPVPTRCLRIADRVAAHLVGDDLPEPPVQRLILHAEPIASTQSAELAEAIRAGVKFSWLQGPPGSPGAETAAAAFAALNVDWLVADLERRPADADLQGLLTDLTREAALQTAGLVLTGADELTRDDHRWLFDRLLEAAVPVVAVGQRAWDPRATRRLPYIAAVPPLPAATRAQLWTRELGAPDRGDGSAEMSWAGARLGPGQIAVAAEHARMLAAVRGRPAGAELVREAARRLSGGGPVHRHAGPAAPEPASFDDIVLPPDAHAELTRLVEWARRRGDILAQGAVQGKGGKSTGLAAMFSGGPGTGKTLAAHVVADALGLDLYQVDLAGLVDKYVGETEKNLERVFAEAEVHDVVLFFDEADAIFGSRSAVQDSRDRYANLEVSYLLQRMEQFDGITVLATNLRGNLDAAFSRRLHVVIHFPDPDEPTRERLWAHHVRQLAGTDPSDPPDLATLAAAVEVSGADIRNIVLAAAYDAAVAGTGVGMGLLVEATAREYRKLGRRLPSPWPPVS